MFPILTAVAESERQRGRVCGTQITYRQLIPLNESPSARVQTPPLLIVQPGIRRADAALKAYANESFGHVPLCLQLDGGQRLCSQVAKREMVRN